MKVSRNWIQQYIDGDLPADEDLAAKIGAQLGGIDEVTQLGPKYAGAVVVQVIACQPHPDSDHLNICRIDDGGVVQGVERDADGFVQVVCGAPNVQAGLTVVWLPPGAIVPETYGSADPFVLGSRPLRGEVSHGMLASPRELAIGDSHEGILVIHQEAAPGTAFAAVLDLEDTVFDIENKMFTHRPDCFGQLGVAREVAGILGRQFHSPQWYVQQPQLPNGNGLELAVDNTLLAEVPRFMAVALKEVVVRPSPLWLQAYLTRVGVRPINNVVDVTNYMMLLTGQPLHAYDYDKVAALTKNNGAHLTVRRPAAGETIALLNGKTITPRAEAIMIASGPELIGVGGVMGGSGTEVSAETVNIILECATFDMYSIRRTSMAHGLFTDAVTRNSKGQSPLQNDRIVGEAIRLLSDVSGAVVASSVIDSRADLPTPSSQTVHVGHINSRLGLDLQAHDVTRLLGNVEFNSYAMENLGEVFVEAPFWRTDIAIAEDVIEEVGRLYGFDNLPLLLPKRSLTPAQTDGLLNLKQSIRHALSKAGANEVLTYSFVPGQLLTKVGQSPDQAFALSNALSPELQYYRLSVLPSLLEKVHANLKAGYDTFALFELGKGHALAHQADDPEGLPQEFNMLSLVFAAGPKAGISGAAYYQARHYLDVLAASLGVSFEYRAFEAAPADAPAVAPYQINRSAAIFIAGTDDNIGVVGEMTVSCRNALKLPEQTAGFDLDLDMLPQAAYRPAYVPASRYPKTEQDICLRVAADVTYRTVYESIVTTLAASAGALRTEVKLLDIYQAAADAKQLTFRISFTNYQKTMTDQEANHVLDAIAKAAAEKYNATRV